MYYLPKDADTFFDMLHEEMMKKYPTLQHSNVKNVLRKVLLTAFHFSVFGRYPEALVKLTLSPAQVSLIIDLVYLACLYKLLLANGQLAMRKTQVNFCRSVEKK